MAWDDVKGVNGILPAAEYNNLVEAVKHTLAGLPFFKIGTFTKNTADATGTQAITGVGFKPFCVIFFVAVSSTQKVSWGMDDATTHFNLNQAVFAGADFVASSATMSITLGNAAGTSYDGYISSLDADGFTITWTKTGLPTGTATIEYMAFR